MATDLLTLEVLLVDCQTTGSNPERHHLIEVGWTGYRAADDPPPPDEVESALVRLPAGEEIPRPIARLTGIGPEKMEGALSPAALKARLHESIERIGGNGGPFPAVAHYARFERAFLGPLWGERPPHPFFCTHEIARRLFTGLPRRGLRALAGFFADPLPEKKRSAVHVAATAAVWRGLVGRLREEGGVGTAEELALFLRSRPAPRGERFDYPLPREKRLALPDRPGVYRFLGGNGDVLYVGKAASLKSRVNSYYRKRRSGERHLEMVTQVKDVEVAVAGSALEAAMLEAEEIGRLDPPYNRALKNEETEVWFCSRFLDSARPAADGGHRIGPFPEKRTPLSCGALRRILYGGEDVGDERASAAELGLRAYPITPGALGEGLRLFAEKTRGEGGRSGSLLSSGTRLWRERVAGSEEEVDGDCEREGRERPRTLGGGEVAGLLEEIALRTAHFVRRARWFSLLSGGRVRWAPASDRSASAGSSGCSDPEPASLGIRFLRPLMRCDERTSLGIRFLG